MSGAGAGAAIGNTLKAWYPSITLELFDFAAQVINEFGCRSAGLLAQGKGQDGQWTQVQPQAHLFKLVQCDACSSTLQLGKERPARIAEIPLRDVPLAAKRAKHDGE